MAFQVKRILVGTDFSEPAQRAADAAVELARPLGASLVLLHVTPPVDYVDYEGNLAGLHRDAEYKAMVAEAAERSAAVELARLRGAGAEVQLVLVDGRPSEVLCSYAEQHQVDLVVVGNQGRGRIARFLMGSVAERVVRHSHVPVLVFRAR